MMETRDVALRKLEIHKASGAEAKEKIRERKEYYDPCESPARSGASGIQEYAPGSQHKSAKQLCELMRCGTLMDHIRLHDTQWFDHVSVDVFEKRRNGQE